MALGSRYDLTPEDLKGIRSWLQRYDDDPSSVSGNPKQNAARAENLRRTIEWADRRTTGDRIRETIFGDDDPTHYTAGERVTGLLGVTADALTGGALNQLDAVVHGGAAALGGGDFNAARKAHLAKRDREQGSYRAEFPKRSIAAETIGSLAPIPVFRGMAATGRASRAAQSAQGAEHGPLPPGGAGLPGPVRALDGAWRRRGGLHGGDDEPRRGDLGGLGGRACGGGLRGGAEVRLWRGRRRS